MISPVCHDDVMIFKRVKTETRQVILEHVFLDAIKFSDSYIRHANLLKKPSFFTNVGIFLETQRAKVAHLKIVHFTLFLVTLS